MERQLWCACAIAVLLSAGARPAFCQQKLDAELKGITTVGVVVEDATSRATACGAKQGALEAAVSKTLADGGLKVVRNSDNDTYLSVNVQTTTVPPALCITRYDVYLYTHTTAKLSYQAAPSIVRVSLVHEGGLAGGSGATHAANVTSNVTQYVEQIADRIKRANQ